MRVRYRTVCTGYIVDAYRELDQVFANDMDLLHLFRPSRPNGCYGKSRLCVSLPVAVLQY